ncbi:MAG TPA: insulinase family protein [Thermoanaerobacterales bacterium]|nr:insulinase family protein [Thermoanaerobacterales bacterium]
MIKEDVYCKKLKCGLDVYLILKKGYKKKFAIYATRYGSIDSEFIVPGENTPTKVPDGIAHFLEHKLFEKEYGNVFDKFAEFGASANAYTSYTHTAYLFSCTDNFEENLELLIDFVQEPYFTEESIEKEKGIIEQELKMYSDDPNWQVFLNLLKAMYKAHPVRNDIGGTVDSIKYINAETLYKCYNTFYHPENMVLLAIGDFNPEKIFNQIENNFNSREYKPQGEITRIYPQEQDEINKNLIEEKLSVAEPLFFMGFKDRNVGFGGEKLFRKEITTRILLDMVLGRSSNLYKELYEDGLIDDRFQIDYDGRKNYGYCVLGGPTQDPYTLHKRILEAIGKTKNILNEDTFERIKKKMVGNYIRGLNSQEFISSVFVSYYFSDIDVFRYLDVLEKITFRDTLYRFEDLIDPNYHSCSIIMPE